MNKIYAGIGSRFTPLDIIILMNTIGEKLARKGYTLRSGRARGADTAFEVGCRHGGGKSEIFLAIDALGDVAALEIARTLHPAWDKLGEYAKLLHARNAYQILGKALTDPVDFVICWTPDGCTSHDTRTAATGGTGTAISLASLCRIKIYNLQIKSHIDDVMELCK